MRKLLLGIVLSSVLFSCATDRYLMTEKEMKETPYSTDGFNVMRDSIVIGTVSSTEIEISPNGKRVVEISITLNGFDKSSEATEVIKFLHTKYPHRKIEVNLDGVGEFK